MSLVTKKGKESSLGKKSHSASVRHVLQAKFEGRNSPSIQPCMHPSVPGTFPEKTSSSPRKMSSLESWVSDELHRVIGYSESGTVRYVLAMCDKARSSGELGSLLRDCDIKDETFATELWRQSRKTEPSFEVKERRTRRYDEVDDRAASKDEDEEDLRRRLNEVSKRQKARGLRHNVGRKERKVAEDDLKSEEDRARERDAEERDALVQRIRERDEARTRFMATEGGLTPAQVAELTQRGVVGGDTDVETMRKISRRAYLEKWEAKQLDLLQAEVDEEQQIFGEEDLTTEELKQHELSKKILTMARDRSRFQRLDEGYRLPGDEDQKKESLADQRERTLRSRYVEEAEPKTEQELWDEEQTKRSVLFKKKKEMKTEFDDYVFEDHVEFVTSAMRLKGINTIDKKTTESWHETVEEERPSKREKKLSEREKLEATRKSLPVFYYRDEFLAAVADNQVLVVIGETGSGKTTQLPQYLHEVGYSKVGTIGCTQPRRVAAMSVSARVSKEMNVTLGREVGYSIRFEDCTSRDTVIKYMTDGMLLREFLGEPDLASYSVMMIDEAHERTLHTDVLFGLIKDIARFREDIKIIISSATMNAEAFSKYFDDAAIFNIPGRTYDVEILYTKAPESDYLDAAVVTILQTHITQPQGDILVFFTGQEEIEACVEILTERTKGLGSRIKELLVCPIYASLPSEQQAKIFEPTPKGARKVVIGTNIAETSLTIDGICYVIDTGFCKQKTYNPRSGVESLIVTPISKAQAAQRAGRAGRTQPGTCFRLYTAWAYQHELEDNTVPEIQRTNMSSVVLMLKSLGIHDLLHFDFMDPPPPEMLIRALEQLYALGALNDRGELTKMGRKMAEFPCDPQLAKSIIYSDKLSCVPQVITVGAMLGAGNAIFYRPKERAVHADNAKLNFARGGGGDHAALLRVYNEWEESDYSTQWCYENYVQARSMLRARDIKDQFAILCERVELDAGKPKVQGEQIISHSTFDVDNLSKSIAGGYFYNAAKLADTGDYKTVKQMHTVHIHPSSVLAADDIAPKWVCFHELAFTTEEYMRMVFPIQPEWLVDIAPHYYQQHQVIDPRKHKMPNTKVGTANKKTTAY